MSRSNERLSGNGTTWGLRVMAAGGALIVATGCGAVSDVSGSSQTSTQPYVLFAPIQSDVTYLMDLQGQLVHQWRSESGPACSVYLLSNGGLLRARSLGQGSFPGGGCNGGRVEQLDWDGRVSWSFDYMGSDHQQHHDVRMMPNGHVLMVAWETRSADEAVAAGRDPSTIPPSGVIWVDHVVEVDPQTNQIVWAWHAWDHLLPPGAEPADHPELIDPNAHATATTSDWTHTNAVDYSAELDQIMVSVRNHNEIWVIDHSTTTQEAAGHTGGRRGRGGDLLYRWGDPADYGLPGPQQLFGQHNAHWIEAGLPGAGEILLFNNGISGLRPYSTVVQIAPAMEADGRYAVDAETGFRPDGPSWQYVANPPESVFAPIISGAQRLASGNTLVCEGTTGRFREVTPDEQTAWSYEVTDTNGGTKVLVFRATRYEPGYPGLSGRTLTPQGPVRVELSSSTATIPLPPR